jgi:hypothetical protein
MDQLQQNDTCVTSSYVDSLYQISGEVASGLDFKHFTQCAKNVYVVTRHVDAFLFKSFLQHAENHRI